MIPNNDSFPGRIKLRNGRYIYREFCGCGAALETQGACYTIERVGWAIFMKFISEVAFETLRWTSCVGKMQTCIEAGGATPRRRKRALRSWAKYFRLKVGCTRDIAVFLGIALEFDMLRISLENACRPLRRWCA